MFGGKSYRVFGVQLWNFMTQVPARAEDVELELLVCMEKSMSRRTSSSLPLSEAG